MTYTFKKLPELLWAAGIAAALVLIQALVTFDPEMIQDWRTWAIGILGGSVRAAAAAVIAAATRPKGGS